MNNEKQQNEAIEVSLSAVIAASESIIDLEDSADEDLFPNIDRSELDSALETVESFRNGSYVSSDLNRSDYSESLEILTSEVPQGYLKEFDSDEELPQYGEETFNLENRYADINSDHITMSSDEIPHYRKLTDIASIEDTEILFGKKAAHNYHFSGEIEEDSTYFISGLDKEDLIEIGADSIDPDTYELGQTTLVHSNIDSGNEVFIDGKPTVFRMPSISDLYTDNV